MNNQKEKGSALTPLRKAVSSGRAKWFGKMFRRSILMPGLLFCSFQSMAQSNYTLASTVGNVECYYKIEQCGDATVVMFKFNNLNNAPVTLSWGHRFASVQEPQLTDGFRQKQLTIPVGVSFPADCQDTQHAAYLIDNMNSDLTPTYIPQVTEYQFKDLAIVP